MKLHRISHNFFFENTKKRPHIFNFCNLSIKLPNLDPLKKVTILLLLVSNLDFFNKIEKKYNLNIQKC